jgi:hypothetical protein
MNERIKELAEQSGCKVMDGEWYIPSATGLEKIVYTKEMGLEKFAELIVRECITAIKNDDGYHLSVSTIDDSYNQGVQMGLEFAITDIAEHFGVEE